MLTQKKRLYAEARESGKSITDSAVWAGCPEKTASQAGSRMEKDADVIACRARLKAGDWEQSDDKPVKKKAPPKDVAPPPELLDTEDPIKFMRDFMRDQNQDPRLRLDAAKALAAFTVAKPGEMGKKQQKQKNAEKVASGRFGAAPPPLKRVK